MLPSCLAKQIISLLEQDVFEIDLTNINMFALQIRFHGGCDQCSANVTKDTV